MATKCKFAQDKVKYLLYAVGGGLLTPVERRTLTVLDFPTGKT